MENGYGQVDVTVDPEKEAGEATVETQNSLACKGNMACSVPTLLEGMDEELRNNK